MFKTITGRQQVRLIDVSQRGAHLYVHGEGAVREGFLLFMHFELFAVAVWNKGGEVGLEFDEDLTYDDLLEIRSMAPAVVQDHAIDAALAARDFVSGERHLGVDS